METRQKSNHETKTKTRPTGRRPGEDLQDQDQDQNHRGVKQLPQRVHVV